MATAKHDMNARVRRLAARLAAQAENDSDPAVAFVEALKASLMRKLRKRFKVVRT